MKKIVIILFVLLSPVILVLAIIAYDKISSEVFFLRASTLTSLIPDYPNTTVVKTINRAKFEFFTDTPQTDGVVWDYSFKDGVKVDSEQARQIAAFYQSTMPGKGWKELGPTGDERQYAFIGHGMRVHFWIPSPRDPNQSEWELLFEP